MAVDVKEAFRNAESIIDGVDAIAQWARSNPAIPEHERRAVLYRLDALRTSSIENRKFFLKVQDEQKEPLAPTKNPPKQQKAPVFEK